MFASRLPQRGVVHIVGYTGGDCVLFSDNDDPVAWSLGWIGEYQPASSRLWQILCTNAALILDIGATTGYYALLAARAAPHGAVVCFETVPRNFARLQKNLELNDVRNVTAVHPEPHDCAASVQSYLMRRGHAAPNAVRIGDADSAAHIIEVVAQTLAQGTADLLMAAGSPDRSAVIENELRRNGFHFYTIDEVSETIAAEDRLEAATGVHSVNRWATRRSTVDAKAVIKAAYCTGGVA